MRQGHCCPLFLYVSFPNISHEIDFIGDRMKHGTPLHHFNMSDFSAQMLKFWEIYTQLNIVTVVGFSIRKKIIRTNNKFHMETHSDMYIDDEPC